MEGLGNQRIESGHAEFGLIAEGKKGDVMDSCSVDFFFAGMELSWHVGTRRNTKRSANKRGYR